MRIPPQPFPYQGSKRKLAPWILRCIPDGARTLFEPFAGSAAVSLAAASNGKVSSFVLNDLNAPLANLWHAIINQPEGLLAGYQRHWRTQSGRERAYYDKVRKAFNASHEPAALLFLLARCVKGAVRYNREGDFNQSPDNRRRGMKPETLAREILAASKLLAGRAIVLATDFRKATAEASAPDIIYMDPPYQGVSGARDARYIRGLALDEFVAALEQFNQRGLSYLISYDGRTGGKSYGKALPEHLMLARVELDAGRSTTATLLGRREDTVESLYLSAPLIERLKGVPSMQRLGKPQRALQFA